MTKQYIDKIHLKAGTLTPFSEMGVLPFVKDTLRVQKVKIKTKWHIGQKTQAPFLLKGRLL